MTDAAVAELAPVAGTWAACAAVGCARAGWYRRHRQSPRPPRPEPIPHRDRRQPRALAPAERQQILDVLHSGRFADAAPAEAWATLLDEGSYLGSVSTFYRVLRERGEVRERRRQATHPATVKPELMASAPNQVWSWDITKLHGPVKWTYYYLYVILDIFSRYVTGWMVATAESAALAERLIDQTCAKQQISAGQLAIHADRGSSMTSKPVAFLLADLGITQSHSRPHVSNDNPFSESQFKTLKYRPAFPGEFGSIQDARAHCQVFFPWYNNQHRHSGLGLHTPADIHYGRASAVQAARASVLAAAYTAHPERFVLRPPAPPKLPAAAWINRPQPQPAPAAGATNQTGKPPCPA
jgi:putative transposase